MPSRANRRNRPAPVFIVVSGRLSDLMRHFPGLGILTEVVQARSTAIELTSQAHLPRQSMERPADVVLVQSSSSFGNEEKVRGWLAFDVLVSTRLVPR